MVLCLQMQLSQFKRLIEQKIFLMMLAHLQTVAIKLSFIFWFLRTLSCMTVISLIPTLIIG